MFSPRSSVSVSVNPARARRPACLVTLGVLVATAFAACSDQVGEGAVDPMGGSPIGSTAGGPANGGSSAGDGSLGGATSGTGGETSGRQGTGATASGEDEDPPAAPMGSPSRLMPELPLQPLSDGRWLYNPHRGGPHRYQGSGHTHSAPDHSNMDVKKQQERLRDLPGALGHDFVWLTAHLTVVADPGVPGITHLFGVENYTKKLPSGGAPHVLAFLPGGDLVGKSQPFGLYNYTLTEMPARIEAAGGLAVLAHPSRYSPTIAETVAVSDALWGIEVVSGGTSPAANYTHLDARLGAGKYTCASAGNDLHAANYGLTTGYQLVSAESSARDALFAAVSACNFFACRTDNENVTPIGAPEVRVADGSIHAAMDRSGTIRYLGKNGAVRKTTNGTSADYTPSSEDPYVRVELSAPGAQCYSQALWIMEE